MPPSWIHRWLDWVAITCELWRICISPIVNVKNCAVSVMSLMMSCLRIMTSFFALVLIPSLAERTAKWTGYASFQDFCLVLFILQLVFSPYLKLSWFFFCFFFFLFVRCSALFSFFLSFFFFCQKCLCSSFSRLGTFLSADLGLAPIMQVRQILLQRQETRHQWRQDHRKERSRKYQKKMIPVMEAKLQLITRSCPRRVVCCLRRL